MIESEGGSGERSGEAEARVQTRSRARSSAAKFLLATATGLGVLHFALALLWDDRIYLGFGLALGPWEQSPALGRPVVLPWVAVLVMAAHFRILERHRFAVAGLSTVTRRLQIKGLIVAGLVYVCAALLGMAINLALGFHFAVSIGLYLLVATISAGIILGGRARPFLDLSLSRRPPARVRRLADRLTLGLSVLLYVEWIADPLVWTWLYGLSTPLSLLVPLLMSLPCAVLGWALLHSSMMDIPRRLVAALEGRAQHVGTGSSLLEWCGQLIAAVTVLGALRIAAQAIAGWWESDSWVFERGLGKQVFLGVDWYFVDAGKSLLAAELFVLLAFPLMVGGCVMAKVKTAAVAG